MSELENNHQLQLQHVAVIVQGRPLLQDITFSIAPGTVLGLIGPSGSGKSVLVKTIAGIFPRQSGEILLPQQMNQSQQQVGFAFQEGALFDGISALENVAFPLIESGAERNGALRRAFEMLGQVGLSQAYKKLPGQLSGGMRRRVAIARALVTDPTVALLDDPTAGLDPVASQVIIDLCLRLHLASKQQRITIIVSHDLRRLLPACDRIIMLVDGAIRFDGNRGQLLTQKSDQFVESFVMARYTASCDDERWLSVAPQT